LVVSSETRGKGHILKYRKFHWNTRKNFFTVKVVKQWHRLLRDCGVPSLEVLKSCLDMVLGNLLWVTLF